MRHKWRRGRLKVTSAHRRAMGRNLVASLFEHGQIRTTLPKAKAFRSFAEKLITLARKGNRRQADGTAEGRAAYLHAVRRAAQMMPNKTAVRRLFKDVAPACGDRPGGYTRVLRLGRGRLGDNATRALFMLVDKPEGEEAPRAAKGEVKKKDKATK